MCELVPNWRKADVEKGEFEGKTLVKSWDIFRDCLKKKLMDVS